MKTTLKIEELAQFILGIFLFSQLNFAWWWFAALLLTPDIGMIGYLINTKIGAFTYNFFHHKAVVSVLLILGVLLTNNYFLLAGLLLLAHSSFDRILGYGLKYSDSFKHTNVGYI